MSQFKAAFFDIDNTLYDWATRQWVESGLEAIKAIKKAGVKVFICSARPYQSIKEFGVFSMGIHWDGYIASAGGIAVTKNRYLIKMLMDPQDVKGLIDVAKSHNLTMELVTPKTRYLIAPGNTFLKDYYGTYSDGAPGVHPYRGGDVTGALLFAPEVYDQEFKKRLPNLIFYRFHEVGVDITPKPHLKGDAIKRILDFYGFSKEEAVSFGDDLQDISMGESSYFVCVGNGREEVKAAADMVTDPIVEDGLKNALVKLGILSAK